MICALDVLFMKFFHFALESSNCPSRSTLDPLQPSLHLGRLTSMDDIKDVFVHWLSTGFGMASIDRRSQGRRQIKSRYLSPSSFSAWLLDAGHIPGPTKWPSAQSSLSFSGKFLSCHSSCYYVPQRTLLSFHPVLTFIMAPLLNKLSWSYPDYSTTSC
jgi:hypothetical protein